MNDPGDAARTLTPDYFDDVYDASADPWNFAASEYEAHKYKATIAALPRTRYDSAFEIGCSIGVLTSLLAERCHYLLAVDVSEQALARARLRCKNLSQVQFEKMFVPQNFPSGNFDLILVSEVGYYLSRADWKKLQEKIIAHLNPGGSVILVHWTHYVHDYPQTGDQVHEQFAANAARRLNHLKGERAADYRLDVWEKASGD